MSRRVVRDVPTSDTTAFCRLQTALGATMCEITDKGDGSSDVIVEFPADESFSALKARRNE